MYFVQGGYEVPFLGSLHRGVIVDELFGSDNKVNDPGVFGQSANTGSRLTEMSDAVEIIDAIDPIFANALHRQRRVRLQERSEVEMISTSVDNSPVGSR